MKRHTVFDKPFLNNKDIEVLLPIFCYGYEIPGKTLEVIQDKYGTPVIYLTDGKIKKEVARIVGGATVDSGILYHSIETITGLKFLLSFWGNKSNIIPVINFPKGLGYDRTLFYKLSYNKNINECFKSIKEKGLENEFLSLYNQGFDLDDIILKLF